MEIGDTAKVIKIDPINDPDLLGKVGKVVEKFQVGIRGRWRFGLDWGDGYRYFDTDEIELVK